MQDISFSLTAAVFLALIALLVAAVMVPAETVGTLQNVHAVPLSGRIVVIQETPFMNFTTTEVEEDSRLRFTRDSEGPLMIHAVVWGCSPTERVFEIYPESIETVREYRSKQRLANQVSSWLKKAMNRTILEREEANFGDKSEWLRGDHETNTGPIRPVHRIHLADASRSLYSQRRVGPTD